MSPEELNFQTFFAAKIKDRGISVKKLSEATGIAPVHIVNLIYGRFDDLPSAPYVRGYLVRLGKELDFNGDEWWEKLKQERMVQDSGSKDALPNNRFIRQSQAKFIWIGIAAALVVLYLAFQIPVIFAKPRLKIIFPDVTPYTTASSTLTFQGTASGANSLTLNGDSVTVAADGTWEKSVLLQNGPNTFEITAKKLLGSEADITEQVFYQGVPAEMGTSTASSTPGAASSTPTATASSTVK
jgi:cytoskeletal protein RodZ